jgi:glycosyltransferase involved in cell wall biosynthesis
MRWGSQRMQRREVALSEILVDATASVSGGAVYLHNLITAWATSPLPFRLTILHTRDLDLTGLPDRSGQIVYQEIWIPSWGGSNWLVGSLYKAWWRRWCLPIHLWWRRPTVFFSNAGSLPGFFPRGGRAVVALHNSMPFLPELWPLEQSWMRRWRLSLLRRQAIDLLRKRVDLLVFSQDLKRRLLALGAEEDRCTVIPHGIEWGERERLGEGPPVASIPSGEEKPLFLYVSQLHRYKNVERLLEALARLRASHPGASLQLVGYLTDPGYAREIAASIRARHLEEAVQIVPGLDRRLLMGLYRSATAVVYPSLAENCPFALLEAMAMGKPIATSRIAAIEEVCGDAALYFDPYDPEDMARQMSRLLEERNLRSALRERAVARAATFAWSHSAQETLDLLSRVATSPDRPGVGGKRSTAARQEP